MKKVAIFMLLSMLLLTVLSFAQSTSKTVILKSDVPGKTASQAVADTFSTSALTKTQTAEIPGFNDLVSVQVILSRISGTAAGKIYLLGSIDGSNYARAGGADSLVIVNVASQSKIFEVTPSRFVKYRIQAVGTGTLSVRLNSVALIRKR